MFRAFKPIFLLLIVPIIDNNALPGRGWTNLHAPWLTPARMLWYRDLYIQTDRGREDWQLSPNLAPKKLLAKCPRTWIAVAEHDLLCTEGMLFAQGLRDSGVRVDTIVYQGSTHCILALNGQSGKSHCSKKRKSLTISGYDTSRRTERQFIANPLQRSCERTRVDARRSQRFERSFPPTEDMGCLSILWNITTNASLYL